MGLLISSYAYDKKPLTLLICMEKDVASELSWKILITGRALSIIQLIVVWILYNSAMNFVKSKSGKKNPPKIFGLFQRNMFTFLQTIIFFTFQSLYQLFQKLLIFSLSDEMARMKNVHLFCDLISTLFVPIILQLFLMVNLNEKIPDLLSESTKSEPPAKPPTPVIAPRRDFKMANYTPREDSRIIFMNEVNRFKNNPEPITSFRKSKVIFVKSKD